MRRIRTLSLLLGLIAVLGIGLSACASSTPATATTGTVIIDVRTPAEYAGGHLRGALNIDVESTSFPEQIAQLPANGDYIVYCHSGSRAARAESIMRSAGFTKVSNGGSIQDASSTTGIPIVTG